MGGLCIGHSSVIASNVVMQSVFKVVQYWILAQKLIAFTYIISGPCLVQLNELAEAPEAVDSDMSLSDQL